MVSASQKVIEARQRSATYAGALAGKSTVVSQSLLGRVGRAACKTVYARQHGGSRKVLEEEIDASIRSLIHTLGHFMPRQRLLQSVGELSLVYVDMYFRCW